MAYGKGTEVSRSTPDERGIQNRLSGPGRAPATPFQLDRSGSRGTAITPLQQHVRRRILLRDVWLKDIFKILTHSPEPLNLGPFQNSPRSWQDALTDLGNPSEVTIQREINQRIGRRRDRGDIEVLVRLDRFIGGMGGDPDKRNWLKRLLRDRSRNEPIHDPQAANAGFNSLKRALELFEPEASNRYLETSNRYLGRSRIREGEDVISTFFYTESLRLFVDAIRIFLGSPHRQVDWSVQDAAIFDVVTYAAARDPRMESVGNFAGNAAFRAWNSLTPRQRAALGWDFRRHGATTVIDRLRTAVARLRVRRGVP